MFERYSEKARRAIFFARYHANKDGSDQITPCHLLLGLLGEDRDLLAALPGGVTYEDLYERVRELYPLSQSPGKPKDLPLSHAAKRVLAYGAETEARLGGKQITPAINLIGMMRERDRGVEHVLAKFSLAPDDVIRSAEAYVRSQSTGAPPPPPSVEWAPQIPAPASEGATLQLRATSSRYEGSTLVIETLSRYQSAEVRMVQRWAPSADGKTLTYSHQIVTPGKTDSHEVAFDL